jgi:hypothetical protein
MSDLMPDVVMPESTVEEEVKEVNPDTEEENPNMVYEETDSKEMPDEVPEPEPKTVTPDEEIFKDVKPQAQKFTKTGRPKRVASQQQKEHLAKMRIRAAEVKRKKKEERLAREEEEMLIKRADRKLKDQHRKAKVKEAEKVLEVKPVKEPAPQPEVIRPEPQPAPAPAPLPRQNTISITKEELLELQQEAIDKYEVKRKKRKEQKQKEQEQKQKDAKAYEQVSRAIHRPPTEDVWGQCFQ